MQNEYAHNFFKTSKVQNVKNYFRHHVYQKWFTVGGVVASVLKTVGLGFSLVSLVALLGQIAAGLAISNLVNPELSWKKALVLLFGGMIGTAIFAAFPFSSILLFATGSVTVAGATGLLTLLIEKLQRG